MGINLEINVHTHMHARTNAIPDVAIFSGQTTLFQFSDLPKMVMQLDIIEVKSMEKCMIKVLQ